MLGQDGLDLRRTGIVTVWTVEKDERGWSVVGPEGTRRSLTGLACITARVIAAELESAYRTGFREGREAARGEIFAAPLGD